MLKAECENFDKTTATEMSDYGDEDVIICKIKTFANCVTGL